MVAKRRSERLALGPAYLLEIPKNIAGVTGSFLETGFARSLLAVSSTFLTNLELQGLRNYKLCAQLIPKQLTQEKNKGNHPESGTLNEEQLISRPMAGKRPRYKVKTIP